eukprot:4664907-Amphidinium_carterae.1
MSAAQLRRKSAGRLSQPSVQCSTVCSQHWSNRGKLFPDGKRPCNVSLYVRAWPYIFQRALGAQSKDFASNPNHPDVPAEGIYPGQAPVPMATLPFS